MKTLETILETAKVEAKIIVANLKHEREVWVKEQARLDSLNIEWKFAEKIEDHGSNFFEWLVTGSKDGIDYHAITFADGTHPQLDDVVTDIQIDK